MSILKNILIFFKDILSPKKCFSCKKEGIYLCEKCFNNLDNFGEYCYICKKKSPNFKIHKKCLIENKLLNWKNFNDKKIYLDNVIVLTHYKNKIIKKLIISFKFYWKKDIWVELWEKLWKLVKNKINISIFNREGLDIVVIPVPLHWLKKIKRWFNQSEILAENIANILNINYNENIIIRKKYTRQQSKLSRQERLNNLNNSFKIDIKQVDNIDNKIIFLVDDVVSSWTTLNEIEKILKQNWAKKVIWVCVASN